MEPPESPPLEPPPPTLRRRVIDLDTTISLRLHRLSKPLPRLLLLALELSGDGRFFFPLVLSSLLLPLPASDLRVLAAALLSGGLLDLLLIGLVKHLVRRPRPVYNKGMSLAFAVDHWSFPSGHASRVCFVASFLYLASHSVEAALRSLGKSSDSVVLVVLLWATATSVSRVLLGRHFVSDVFAGACLGIIEGLAVFRASRAFDFELRQVLSL